MWYNIGINKLIKMTMKNKKMLIATMVIVAIVVGLLTWVSLSAKNNKEQTKRVVITPNSIEAQEEILKNKKVDVQHVFDAKFSAEVPESLIPELQAYAEVADVVQLEINEFEPEYCGDGDVAPSEQCGEPGLDECKDGKVCNYCQCVNKKAKKAFERTCSPNDQIPYNIAQINAGQIGSGEGIDVAVLDTGAFTEHSDLDIHVCKDTTQKGIKNGCEDTIWHGTHTAGTVGANGGPDNEGIYGGAPAVNVWAIKVCYSIYCNEDDMAEAVHYAAKRGAEVISMSIGSPVPAPVLQEAIEAYPDVLFVASAGNQGYNGVKIEYPAAHPEVIAVAAHDVNKIVTSFSARGVDDGDDSMISEQEIEFSAGGRSVPSTFSYNGCYANGSGTSMAAPTIAGLAAKLWQGDAESTRMYLRTIVEDITQSNGPGAGPGYDIASGYGMPVAP